MNERQYLLRRCLRLEARIITLQQKLADTRPNRRFVMDADRERMCALHRAGATPRTIAIQTGWSINTVYNTINAQPLERTVGE
jgi:hypothetical protein